MTTVATTGALSRPRARAGLLAAVVACVAISALSLLVRSAPTYDPWAWIIWGREVMHLDLDTVDGPSWKPLPILFTAPFSLFGSAAPGLWLLVARAGSLGALIVAWRLAARLGGVAAGAAATVLLLASNWMLRNALLGNSEGLMVLVVLWCVERHIAGNRAQAFALGVAAGLLRPEAWPFLGLYALFLLWEDRRRLPWVAGGLVLLPLLWLLPELWGSGDLWRASDRANTPNANSPAFADRPSIAVLANWLLLVTPTAWLGLGAALALAVRDRARIGAVGGMAVLAVAWLALVAVMTEAGYSGNQRYLIAPTALLYVVGGVGLARLGSALLSAGRGLGPRVAAGALAAAVLVGSFVWAVDRMPYTVRDASFQARVADQFDAVVDRAGGRDALLACGTPFTNPYLVQLVAWKLDVHGEQVVLDPPAQGGAVMLRARHALHVPSSPRRDALAGRPDRRVLAHTDLWWIETACRS